MKNNKLYACLWAFLVLLLFPFLSHAQYTTAVVASTTHATLLVGSLPVDNLGNYQKLQVDVLGGGWGASNLGKTTYYVGNRGGITIYQTTMGSASADFTIKAYANPGTGNTDIYIVVTADYPAIAINSFMLTGNAAQTQSIVQQTPVGTDITPTIVPVMITDQNGNISLNTTDSKGYKLAVNGSAIATSVTVKANGSWPDYVFKPSYHLTPLSEVKTYVDLNHHLPEIPSEKEIATNGLNLGDIDRLLTKKVEELTLYLIEKDEKEKEQQTQLDAQKEQLQSAKAQLEIQADQLKQLKDAVSKLTESINKRLN